MRTALQRKFLCGEIEREKEREKDKSSGEAEIVTNKPKTTMQKQNV